MITLTGKKVSEGIVIGRLAFYKRGVREIRRIYVEDVTKEVLRFQKAKEKALQELKAAIKAKQPERLYIFHGVETFLLHHYQEQLRKQLVDELTESFNFHKLNNETFDLEDFADAVENLPMMAEHTFIWVDDVDFFKSLK